MYKLAALFLITLAAVSHAEPSVMGIRRPRFFGLSSWFGGGGDATTEETTELPVPDLTAHPLWRVHKYKGISLHPVNLPLDGGSASPASHVLPPPSASLPYAPPAPTYGPPAPTYGVPAHTYGPPAQTYGPPAQTYGPPAATAFGASGQSQVSESGASASDVSKGLDALGSLASFLPDSDAGAAAGSSGTGKSTDKSSLLQSTLQSVLNIKGNLGTAISGLASGKSAALSSLIGGEGHGALLGLLAQYPQLASLLARKQGSKGGYDMPKLPELPEMPFIGGMDVIPELPEMPELKVPAAPYAPPAQTYGPPPTVPQIPQTPYPAPTQPASEYGPPAGSFGSSSSFANAASVEATAVPETTYGVPATFEPRLPQTTYGSPAVVGFQNTEVDPTMIMVATSPVLIAPSPSPNFASRRAQPTTQQADLYTTVRFNDQGSVNTVGQIMARNSDTKKEAYVDASRFRPSTELRSEPESAGSSFFPVAREYVSPFVQYRDDSEAEASARDEQTAAASDNAEEYAEYEDEPAPETHAAPDSKTKVREFPVTAARAAFSDRFRGGNVHVATGEVTIDTAMKVHG